MDIAAILGLGAIGLGFLLACLAYRLLSNSQQKERPIYIFMVFCLVLVGVGAALQYTDSSSKAALAQTTKDLDSAKEQHKGLETDLAAARRQIEDLQRKLNGALANLASTETSLNNSKAQNVAMAKGMKAIIDALAPTQGALQQVQAGVTNGEVCPGGAHGRPLPHGSELGAQISDALSAIARATNIAGQFRQ